MELTAGSFIYVSCVIILPQVFEHSISNNISSSKNDDTSSSSSTTCKKSSENQNWMLMCQILLNGCGLVGGMYLMVILTNFE